MRQVKGDPLALPEKWLDNEIQLTKIYENHKIANIYRHLL